jgi:hypothetical protein
MIEQAMIGTPRARSGDARSFVKWATGASTIKTINGLRAYPENKVNEEAAAVSA